MKLNFWQIVGLLLLIAGIVVFVRRKTADTPVSRAEPATIVEPSPSTATTVPSTAPSRSSTAGLRG